MDREPENEGNEVKNDTERVLSADPSNEEDDSTIIVHRNEKEGVSAEMVASGDDDENSERMKATEEALVEEAASGVDCMNTSQDLGVKMKEVSSEPVSHEEGVVLEINGSDDDGPPRLHLGPPERETSPAQEEEAVVEEEEKEEEGPTAAPADTIYEEYMQLLRELCAERDKAGQHSRQLQAKLAEYFRKNAGGDGQPERETVPEQLREYEKCMNALTDLQQQLCADSVAARQQAEELRSQSQEKLRKVETEWRAFLALKQDAAVAVLSRHLGKQAAQAKVEPIVAAEQLRQDELIRLRLKHIKLKIKIRRLEAELRDGDQHAGDPLQLQFEQLQAERLELKKQAERQHEESLKMQKKISGSLELLSNIKEKLYWSQMEVKSKREQLAELEATVARKRDILTRTKQARNRLQKDNLRMKEGRGLLGNRFLLQDFQDTIDASNHLEEQLEKLKSRQACLRLFQAAADGRRSRSQPHS